MKKIEHCPKCGEKPGMTVVDDKAEVECSCGLVMFAQGESADEAEEKAADRWNALCKKIESAREAIKKTNLDRMQKRLLPCPNCGHVPDELDDFDYAIQINCQCGLMLYCQPNDYRGPSGVAQYAVSQWNRFARLVQIAKEANQ